MRLTGGLPTFHLSGQAGRQYGFSLSRYIMRPWHIDNQSINQFNLASVEDDGAPR